MEAWISKVQSSIDDIKKDLLKLIEEVDKLKMGEQQLKYLIDRNKKINEEMVERARKVFFSGDSPCSHRGRGEPT